MRQQPAGSDSLTMYMRMSRIMFMVIWWSLHLSAISSSNRSSGVVATRWAMPVRYVCTEF